MGVWLKATGIRKILAPGESDRREGQWIVLGREIPGLQREGKKSEFTIGSYSLELKLLY